MSYQAKLNNCALCGGAGRLRQARDGEWYVRCSWCSQITGLCETREAAEATWDGVQRGLARRKCEAERE